TRYVIPTATTPNTKAERLIGISGTNIDSAAPNAAPDDMPKEKGSTIGFLKIACNTPPDTASAAPTIKVNRMRGKRTCHKIVSISEEAPPTSFPKRRCRAIHVYCVKSEIPTYPVL